MNVELYTSEDVFQQLKPEWNSLLNASLSNRIFLTWEWQSIWWAAYHPGQLWVVAVRGEAGQLVGLAPWFIEERAKTGRTVRTVGCVDVTDYLETLVHPDYAEAVFQALADFVIAHQDAYDTIDLCNIPEDSPVLTYFPAALESRGLSVSVKPQEVCPIIELPSTFEAYINSLDKKNRHELRRKMRRVEGENGAVDWYIVGPQHDLAAELETFLQLMRTAHPSKAEFLENDAHVTFFRTLVPVLAQEGWLQLAFLRVNGQPAAAYLDFDYNREILVYNSGLDLSVASQLSAGIVLLANLIEDAIKRGYTHFDFLRGNEDYKYRMGGRDKQLYMLIAVQPEPVDAR